MKLIILITFLFITITTCMAAVSRGIYKDSSHPGKCVVEGLILSPGEDAQHPTSCEKILCNDDSLVVFHSCGSMSAPPGYKFGKPINANAAYPECCKKEIIPE